MSCDQRRLWSAQGRGCCFPDTGWDPQSIASGKSGNRKARCYASRLREGMSLRGVEILKRSRKAVISVMEKYLLIPSERKEVNT